MSTIDKGFGLGLFDAQAAQLEAKALLSRIMLPASESIRFSFDIQRLIRNMTAVLVRIEDTFIDSDGEPPSEDLVDFGRRVAQLWEAIAYVTPDEALIARLNAAAAYELSGYQANSLSIAKQMSRAVSSAMDSLGNANAARVSDIQAAIVAQRDPFVPLTTLFLQRRLRDTFATSRVIARNPAILQVDAPVYGLIVTLYAQGIMYASLAFLSGNFDLLAHADKSLATCERLSASKSYADISTLVRSIRAIIAAISNRSTWTVLREYISADKRWSRYARLLARGNASRTGLSAHSIVEFWPSQIAALRGGLLSSNANAIIRMPTSSGKTRIAELAIARALFADSTAKCIYVAPFRALVNEVTASLSAVIGDLGFTVSAFIETSVDNSTQEEELLRSTSVLVITPEKLDLILRGRPELAEQVHLVVIDEGHVLGELDRGLKFEMFVSRIKRTFEKSRLLLLSAVINETTLSDLANWLNVPAEKVIDTEWRPTVQRLCMLDWRNGKGIIRYAPDKHNEQLHTFVPRALEPIPFTERSTKTGKELPRLFPRNNSRADIAAGIGYRFAELGPVMIFATRRDWAESVAKSMALRIDIAAWSGEAIPAYFTVPRESRSLLLAKDLYPDAVPWLSRGIAIHHRMMPDRLKAAIEEDFRDKKFRIMIATSTLAQGVNFPVRCVVFHSYTRFDEETQTQVGLLARDYWNIAGRAGRAGEETESLIVQICKTDGERESFYKYVESQRRIEPLTSAFLKYLASLARNRVPNAAATASYDSQILAMLAEEAFSTEEDVDEICATLFHNSLAFIQADRLQISRPSLLSAFATSAKRVAGSVPRDMLDAFAVTGLSSESCLTLNGYIDNNIDMCAEFATQGGLGLGWRIALDLNALEIAEAEADSDVEVDSGSLLTSWLEGVPLSDIFNTVEHTAKNVGELARYIEDAFSSKLSWVVNAFSNILIRRIGLNRDSLSRDAQYLGTMVRSGLPDPVACWSMRAGIPSREVAARISEGYQSEFPSGGESYRDFQKWYAALDAERLLSDFGMPLEFLSDIARNRTGFIPNLAVRELKSTEEYLPREFHVVMPASMRQRIASGARLELRRVFDDPLNRNQIGIYYDGVELAKLPQEIAEVLAPDMDTGSAITVYAKHVLGRIIIARVDALQDALPL